MKSFEVYTNPDAARDDLAAWLRSAFIANRDLFGDTGANPAGFARLADEVIAVGWTPPAPAKPEPSYADLWRAYNIVSIRPGTVHLADGTTMELAPTVADGCACDGTEGEAP